MDFDCKMHAGALIAKSGMTIVDAWLKKNGHTWRYYSGIAKLVHVWRDSSRNMFKEWVYTFGAQDAIRCARRLPPKPVSGRWGCIAA
eukprot:11611262-Karenia_brevis.AAC.1